MKEMKMTMSVIRRVSLVAVTAVMALAFAAPAFAVPTAVATYFFQDTLAAEEGGAPSLTAVDPLGQNAFQDATVFGQPRRVYRLDGNASPDSQNAGLTLDTNGLVPANNYSVEMVFEFLQNPNSWRKVLDPHNVSPADHALFVDNGNRLDVWTGSPHQGATTLANNTFHHVVLTNANTGSVSFYHDGSLEGTIATTVMNIDNLLGFFRDEGGEYSDARVALIRLYDTPLSAADVGELASDPFLAAIPEPGTLLLFGSALLGLGAVAWRRSRRK